jgi:hypothetical protein
MYDQRTHLARKEHHCDTCGAKVRTGERYSLTVHKPEGDFCVWKEHIRCRELGLAYLKNTGEDFYTSISDWDPDAVIWAREDFPDVFERRRQSP